MLVVPFAVDQSDVAGLAAQVDRIDPSGSHFEIGLDLCCGELTQVGFFGGHLEARLIPP
jgi:hypothetical protein